MTENNDSRARLFCLVVGATLVFAGIVGFFYESSFTDDETVRDGVFGVLDVNGWHNVVHLLTGAITLLAATRFARTWCLLFGVVYGAVALWGFAAGDGGMVLAVLPVNTEDNILHLVLALGGLAVYALTAPRDARAGRRAAAH